MIQCSRSLNSKISIRNALWRSSAKAQSKRQSSRRLKNCSLIIMSNTFSLNHRRCHHLHHQCLSSYLQRFLTDLMLLLRLFLSLRFLNAIEKSQWSLKLCNVLYWKSLLWSEEKLIWWSYCIDLTLYTHLLSHWCSLRYQQSTTLMIALSDSDVYLYHLLHIA